MITISTTTRLVDSAILLLLSWPALVGTAEAAMAQIGYQMCDSASRLVGLTGQLD